MSTPTILVIHNYYRNKGGEDTVVMHETAALKRAGVKVLELYFQNPHSGKSISRLFRFFSGIFFNVSAYLQVYRTVRKNQVDVVHAHNTFYRASPSVLWAARHAGARVVVTLHNYRLFCLNALFFRDGMQCTRCFDDGSFRTGIRHGCFRNSRWQSFFLASSLKLHKLIGSWHRAVDQFIIVNPAMELYLKGMGIESSRIHLKPNCIDDQPFTPYIHRGRHYLFAGRLEQEKGLPEVLSAWKQFDMPLHIAGEGSMQATISNVQQHNIHYLGLLGPEGMHKELASCKALIFGSKLMEGMPLSIIEAMASGIICIARATTVTSMLIEDGVSGILFDNKQGGVSFVQAVNKLEQMSPAALKRMSEAARHSYETRFTMREHIRHIQQVYKVPLKLPEKVWNVMEMEAGKALAI